MPFLTYTDNTTGFLTRDDIQNPREPWLTCRSIRLVHHTLNDATMEELRRWLEKSGPYVESIDAKSMCYAEFPFFAASPMDRIPLFGPQFGKTPRLKELRVSDFLTQPKHDANCPTTAFGDLLLFALTGTPALEKLTLGTVSLKVAERDEDDVSEVTIL